MKTINKKTFHRCGMSAWLLICLVLVAIFSIMPIFAYAETEGDSQKSGLSTFTILWIFVVILGIKTIINSIQKSHDSSKNDQITDLESQLKKERENSKDQKDSFNSQLQQIKNTNSNALDSLNSTLANSKHEYELLEGKYNTLVDRFKRAETLHPGIDQEITDMINEEIRQKDMKLAQAVDEKLQSVSNLTANKNLVSKLQSVIGAYNELTDVQKSYVTTDISKVNALYYTSSKLKKDFDELQELKRCKANASRAQVSISNIIRNIHVGRDANLYELRRAYSIYSNLDSTSMRLFDPHLARKLDELLSQAQADHNRIEAEEAARRHREEEQRRAEERRRREQEEAERRRHIFRHL